MNMIYYMRDNHTFALLSNSAEEAKATIRQEFGKGYSYGMICAAGIPIKPVHAYGELKLNQFLNDVDGFYREIDKFWEALCFLGDSA